MLLKIDPFISNPHVFASIPCWVVYTLTYMGRRYQTCNRLSWVPCLYYHDSLYTSTAKCILYGWNTSFFVCKTDGHEETYIFFTSKRNLPTLPGSLCVNKTWSTPSITYLVSPSWPTTEWRVRNHQAPDHKWVQQSLCFRMWKVMFSQEMKGTLLNFA